MPSAERGRSLPGLGALVACLDFHRGALALLLDFDGTLAPICDHPGDARPEPAALRALEALSPKVPLAIVSGRGLTDLMGLIDLPGSTYFGSHGQEVKLPGGQIAQPFGDRAAALAPLLAPVRSVAEQHVGSWVEQKPQAVVLHYRNLGNQEELPRLRARIAALAGQFPQLRLMAGRKVFEFVPASAPGKGGAVNWFLDQLGSEPRSDLLPVIFGDDVTDEAAFGAVETNGIGVLVARRARTTAATYRVSGVNEVAAALTLLARKLSD